MGLAVVFSNGGYRRLWLARTLSQSGDAFNTVALAILVLGLTGSGVGVSGLVLAEILPVLLLAPLAGALVDRLPALRLMVGADLWRAALAATLPFVVDNLAAVYAVAFGMAIGAVLFAPSAGTVLPGLVGPRQLVAANSGIWSAAVLAQIVLAPAAGFLVLALGPGPAFAINAASFLVSAVILRRLPVGDTHRPPSGPRRWLTGIGLGARLIRRDRVLRALAAGQLLAALSAGATSALLVVLARDHLRLDAGGYGLLLAAVGVGAAIGPLLLTRLVSDPLRPAFVIGPFVLRGVVDLALAALTAVPLALVALVGYGMGTSVGAVTFTSLVQARAPEASRGRVLAGFDLLWQLGRLVSLLVGGVAADRFGIRAVYAVGGLLLVCAAGVATAGLRSTPCRSAKS